MTIAESFNFHTNEQIVQSLQLPPRRPPKKKKVKGKGKNNKFE